MKKTNQIISINTNDTNNTKGVNKMKKTRKFKTRILAGILSTITVFSVGTMAIGSASAAAQPAVVGNVLTSLKDTTLGLAQKSLLKLENY